MLNRSSSAWSPQQPGALALAPEVRPATPKLGPPPSVTLRTQDPTPGAQDTGRASGCEPLTSLAQGAVGTHHLAALWDGCAGRPSGARTGLAVVGLACEGVAIETWQAALTGGALGVMVTLADP